MERAFTYGIIGCLIATMLSLVLKDFQQNLFILLLLPMWGMILAMSLAKVVDMKEAEKAAEKKAVPDQIIYQKPKKAKRK